jgi:signal transduction histidine kinase/DNA-binding response OmpR family regulator
LVNKTLETLKKRTIIQEPSHSYIEIELGLADYFNSNDLRYFYKIEGLHDDFQLVKGNTLQLIKLPYGKYQIQLKGQAADKRYSTKEVSLSLVVVRPVYLKWWFIFLVISTVILGSWQFYNYRVSNLKKQKVALENIVAQRTEEIGQDKIIIEEKAEELKELDKLKDRFFTNISHELRTPLSLILGPLNSIVKDKNLTNKQFTYLQVITRHANYLLKRINEIMELNRLEVNKSQINLQPVRFYDFVKLSISNFESIAPQKNIKYTFDYQMNKDIQILLDKDKFEHIIYNYLSNAFKYTPKDGAVNVIIKEVNNKIWLVVNDAGPGIPKGDIPHLFKRFYQAETAEKASSSGIGLALCREIAELLDGRVWVESGFDSAENGSTFFFEMPYKEAIGVVESEELAVHNSEVSRLIENDEAPKGVKSTILVVEDNAELRAYIASVLSAFYHVETAENGKEALKRLTISSMSSENHQAIPIAIGSSSAVSDSYREQPSLIVSDIMMPVMDGLELLETLKKSDTHRHIPIIMLTARASMQAKLSALQLGVDDYITKPFNEDELLIRVRNLLQNQQERLIFIQEETETIEPVDKVIQISAADQKWLTEFETTIITHLRDSRLNMNVLAEILFMSDRQIRRRLKKLTGLTFSQYLKTARMKKARQLLEDGEKSTVAEVSYEVGLDTPKYFSKLFFETYGKRPIEYLK